VLLFVKNLQGKKKRVSLQNYLTKNKTEKNEINRIINLQRNSYHFVRSTHQIGDEG